MPVSPALTTRCSEENDDEAAAELDAMSPEDRVRRFRAMARAILQAHRAEDLIPASGKMVVFDHDLPVKYAFYGMLEHNIKCAPVWDATRSDWVGMLTVTDFIDILRYYYHQDQWASVGHVLGEQCIRQWAAIKASTHTSIPHLLSIDPEGTLWEALQTIQRYHIHRLPVLQKIPENTILSMLTHQRILNFVLVKFKLAHELMLLQRLTVADIGIGSFATLHTVKYDTKLVAALDVLSLNKISAAPVVDDDGVLLDVYSRGDVLFLVMDKTYLNLDITVRQALGAHNKTRPVPICCREDTLYTVFKRLVQTRKQRAVVVEPATRKAIGTISLSDIFNFLLDESGGETAAAAATAAATAATAATGSAAAAAVDSVERQFAATLAVSGLASEDGP